MERLSWGPGAGCSPEGQGDSRLKVLSRATGKSVAAALAALSLNTYGVDLK